jgi:hypothetical protein
MCSSATYSERVSQLLSDWALLAGDKRQIDGDPRAAMLFRSLKTRAGSPCFKSRLCADGSPVEFCERISVKPQFPALTMEPAAMTEGATEGAAAIDKLCRALESLATEAELLCLKRQLSRLNNYVDAYWIGVDFAQAAGMRLYCHLRRAQGLPDAKSLACRPFSPAADRAIRMLKESGTLRMVAFDVGTAAAGVKLAFEHEATPAAIEEIAGACGVPFDPLCEYISALDSRGGSRPSRERRGLAIAIDGAGNAAGLTLYHYAAPHFRDDEELRAFVLGLAGRFRWTTDTYRAASRLLDRQGERVRSLVGFTAPAVGSPSLRLYGRTGACA